MLEPTREGMDRLLDLYTARTTHYLPMHTGMKQIEQIYTGEFRVAFAELNKDDRAAVPNLLKQGVDQMAGRVASVAPQVFFASDNPGQRTADRRATTASRTIAGWWEADRLPLKTKQRARHLIAYGMSPAVITYDPVEKRPRWNVRNPMECFPSTEQISGSYTPSDVIFAFRRPASWLMQKGYGQSLTEVTARRPEDIPKDQQFLLLEYIDPDCHALVLAGTLDPTHDYSFSIRGAVRASLLAYAINPTGVMNAVVPTRVSLSRPSGQFDSMIAMYYMQSRLMALEIAAVEKGIFPDTYLVSRAGETGRFLEGPFDGRSGKVNIVTGGDVKEMDTSPGYKTDGMIDRLERSQRLTAGIPAEFGGESATNIRTGRRGDQVLSGVIDFPVAEAQDALAFALQDEDRAAIALSKHYDGSTPRTIYVGTGNQAQKVTYVADQVFTHTEHKVSYPVSGADVNSLVMGLGQRVGMGTMSKETAAEMDPWIDNAETEHDRIIAEGLEQALVGGLQQQAAAGSIPPLVLSKIMTLVRNDKMELADAMVKVTEDAAKEQQAQQDAAQQVPPTAEQQMAPNAQQALAGPIPGPSQAQQSLSGLLTSLRKPAMAVADRTGLTDRNTGRQLV